MGSSPTRGSSFFLGKVTALGVLCCFALFVCLTLLASFFLLISHLKTCTFTLYIVQYLNEKARYMYMYIDAYTRSIVKTELLWVGLHSSLVLYY